MTTVVINWNEVRKSERENWKRKRVEEEEEEWKKEEFDQSNIVNTDFPKIIDRGTRAHGHTFLCLWWQISFVNFQIFQINLYMNMKRKKKQKIERINGIAVNAKSIVKHEIKCLWIHAKLHVDATTLNCSNFFAFVLFYFFEIFLFFSLTVEFKLLFYTNNYLIGCQMSAA